MSASPVLHNQLRPRKLAGIFAAASALTAALAACGGDTSAEAPFDPALTAAYASITADGMMDHIRALSADSMEGRAPASAGEEKTVRYIEQQFRDMGLSGGMPDGSFIQNVSLVSYTAHPEMTFSIGSRQIPFSFPADYVAVAYQNSPVIDVNADMIFVGYGVEAPEYNWDDYKGVDTRGKVLVMLVNDPPIPDPADSSKLDDAMFKGSAMTYYGRWTYKYEIGYAKGAAAVLIIHETGPAGYPFEVVSGSWSRENFDIKTSGSSTGHVPVEGWITLPKAQELFQAAGLDFDKLKAQARTREFRPVSLGARAHIHVRNETGNVESRNVVAVMPGSDSTLSNEYVVYTAHWDHLGRDTTLSGDQIYNGASDNASGVAGLLEIAKAYTRLSKKPPRSVMFVALTAEEQGLLGARYFVANPPVPLTKMLANINMDILNQWGRTSDFTVVGLGNSTLDDVLIDVLNHAGRTVKPDPEPEKGFYYRSDHFEFAKEGVPALYTEPGIEFIGKDPGYGMTKREEYTTNDYHKPSDEIKADWDLSGAVSDARVLLDVGYRVLNASTWPVWKEGTEFKARRDSMLGIASEVAR